MEDEFLKGLDERPTVDTRSVIVQIGVATDIVDDDIDRLEPRTALTRLVCCANSSREETPAHPTNVSERLELRGYCAQSAADVVVGVEFAPFLE